MRPTWPVAALLLVFGGCATTGSTLGSGVGDRYLARAPYYAGVPAAQVASEGRAVGHLPISFQSGASQPGIFDPAVGEAMQALLAEMNAYLDSLGLTRRLVDGGRVSAVAHGATRVPPDVQFGCATVSGDPEDDCALDGDTVLGREHMRMRLAVGRPSREWVAWMGQVMSDTGVGRTLVISLEVGQYLTRQRGFRGTKEVELGTGHVQALPWLTSLETPVAVLQLTGAVVEPDGRAVRIGAEGLLARRTSMRVSALGAQELIGDADVQELRVARREDLPGAPLAWRAGLQSLVTQLLGLDGSV